MNATKINLALYWRCIRYAELWIAWLLAGTQCPDRLMVEASEADFVLSLWRNYAILHWGDFNLNIGNVTEIGDAPLVALCILGPLNISEQQRDALHIPQTVPGNFPWRVRARNLSYGLWILDPTHLLIASREVSVIGHLDLYFLPDHPFRFRPGQAEALGLDPLSWPGSREMKIEIFCTLFGLRFFAYKGAFVFRKRASVIERGHVDWEDYQVFLDGQPVEGLISVNEAEGYVIVRCDSPTRGQRQRRIDWYSPSTRGMDRQEDGQVEVRLIGGAS